jgi:peptidoglycan/xylan/chitin deacetylase (PgdA/CDA1 family)
MTTSRYKLFAHLLSSLGLSIISIGVSQANAAVTACETTALANANFEAPVAAKAAEWCDDYARGYSRVLLTPAKYNYVARASIPTTVPADQRYAGPYQIVHLNQMQAKNVFVGAMIKANNVVLDPEGWGATLDVGFTVDCAAHPQFCEYHGNPDDNTLWCATLPSSGTFDWRWVGLDKTAWVFPILGGATGTAYFDLIQLMEFSPGPGAVTFMFDDGYKSTKDVAKPILDQYGFPGSAAAISSVVATNEEMTAQDLRDLQAAGWDIASHSVTHPSFPTLSISAARTELLNSKNRLTGWGLTIDSFVWPYGDYNQAVIGLAQAGLPSAPLYKSARNVEFDDNAYGTFPYALKVLELVNTTTFDEVKSWIDDVKAGGRWGILLMHDVVENPGTYAIRPALLNQVAQYVKSTGLSVINYRTGYQTFANISAP